MEKDDSRCASKGRGTPYEQAPTGQARDPEGQAYGAGDGRKDEKESIVLAKRSSVVYRKGED